MIPKPDETVSQGWETESLVAFDEALAAGQDPELVGLEKSPLVAVHECQRLLEEVWPRSAVRPHEFPRQVGRFTLVRELGRGGFGVVFLAADPSLSRPVALKLPHPDVLISPDSRRRFLREAEAACRLEHPNIVTVFEVGQAGPVGYIASAYCAGGTMAEWLHRQSDPVDVRVAAKLAATLADAVGHAHQRGILHRDLKPSNILLQPVDPNAPKDADWSTLGFIPKIGDFGLAKLLDEDFQETRSGVPIGSPTYMAPEQARGRASECGPPTDVHALGVVLFEVLTGRPPLQADTPLETIRLVAERDPPSPRVLRPEIPRDLETICLKCLEKHPARRYGNGTEVAEDLRRFLDGRPIAAQPVPVWEQVWKWGKRHPSQATLVAFATLVVVGVIGVFLWFNARSRSYHLAIRAEQNAQEARIQAARTEEREQFERRYGFSSQVRLMHQTFASGNVGLTAKMLSSFQPPPGQRWPSGFAWNYLRHVFRPRITTLGHELLNNSVVLKVAVSPGGQTAATGLEHGHVILWDLVNGQASHVLNNTKKSPASEVYHLSYSPDGRRLASGSNDGVVKVWDTGTGKELAAFRTEPRSVFYLDFTDSQEHLVIFTPGDGSGKIRLRFWGLARDSLPALPDAELNETEIPTIDLSGKLVPPSRSDTPSQDAPWTVYAREHLRMVPDGPVLLLRSAALGVKAFMLVDFNEIAEAHEPTQIPVIREYGVGPWTIATLTRADGILRRALGSRPASNGSINGPHAYAALSQDGHTQAVYQRGVGVVVSDQTTQRVVGVFSPEQPWRVVDGGFTPDGRTLVLGGFHTQLHLWRLGLEALAGHKKEVWSLAFSPDGERLASAADDHTIKLWDVATGRELATLKGHGSLVTCVSYSPDGKTLASASFDKTIRLWDASTYKELAVLSGHTDRVRALAFAPDGRRLASGGNDGTVRLWNIASARELAVLDGHQASVFSVAFSPDGNTLYSGGLDKTVRSWDGQTGSPRDIWQAAEQVHALALSSDGRTLAVTGYGGYVSLWDVAQGKQHPPLSGHKLDVLGIAFSADGTTLASASRDKTIRLWDPVTRQELAVLKGHQHQVHAVAFAPDGSCLASASHDGAITIWRADPEDPKRD